MIDCTSSGKEVDVSALYNITVTSPDYPSNYDGYSLCVWKLSAESGYVVKAVFNDFNLGKRYRDDTLTFRDGFSWSSSLLVVYISTVHPEVVISTGRYLHITFSSDSVGKGFNISVSAVKKGTTVILVN